MQASVLDGTPSQTITLTNALASPSTPYRIRGIVPQLGPVGSSIIGEAKTSFPCAPPQRALTSRELSEAYHRADNKKLSLAYWEDYNDDQLNYEIRSMDGNIVIDDSNQPIAITHGYNEIEIDMIDGGSELNDGFYWLEITNDKGIKRYLRFHYDNTAQ